jgi:hypothetical protein
METIICSGKRYAYDGGKFSFYRLSDTGEIMKPIGQGESNPPKNLGKVISWEEFASYLPNAAEVAEDGSNAFPDCVEVELEGKSYHVYYKGGHYFKLPDGRILCVGQWLESYPPQPAQVFVISPHEMMKNLPTAILVA